MMRYLEAEVAAEGAANWSQSTSTRHSRGLALPQREVRGGRRPARRERGATRLMPADGRGRGPP